MKGCDKLVDVGRRQFLRGGALATAGAAAAAVLPSAAEARPPPARVDYPSNRLANVSQLKPNTPLDISYPDRDSPGRSDQAWHPGSGRRRPGRRHRRLLDAVPAQGLPAQLHRRRQDAELPRPLLALRLREGRPADHGPGHPEPAAVHAARRGQRRHLRRGRRRADLRPPVERALREEATMAFKRQIDRLPIIPADAKTPQRHLPLLHRRLRLSCLHLAGEQAGRH